MTSKKVSIIMPIYNVEKYLAASIQSVLDQDYDNFELLMVDDGSTDASGSIASDYEESDSRLHLLCKNNGGLSDARNFGLKHATGDYVVFIDSDDFWESNLLSANLQTLEDSGADVVVFGYYVDNYDPLDRLVVSNEVYEKKVVIKKDSGSGYAISNKQLLGYAWNKIYKRSLIVSNNLSFRKGLSYIEDIIFNKDVYRFAKVVVFNDAAFYHYAQRHRDTLGGIYHKNLASLDNLSLQAFRESLESLCVHRSQIGTYISQLALDKSRWSIGIIASTDKIARSVKIDELRSISDNITKYVTNFNLGAVSRVYVFLMNRSYYSAVLLLESLKNRNVKRFVLDVIPNQLKAELRYYLSRRDDYVELSKETRKVLITLAADYGNLGDLAITYAQESFLSEHYKDYQIVRVPVSATYSTLRKLRSRVSRKDLVTIIGGGNMGDMYEDLEEQRRFIVRKFKKNKIISFPQTMDFSDTVSGIKSKARTQKVYNAHADMTLFAREEKSYREMKKLFTGRVFLTPDIVLSLNQSDRQIVRDKNEVVVCIRGDDESSLSSVDKDNILDALKLKYNSVRLQDTHIGDVRLSKEASVSALEKIWGTFKGADLVVTDRLHGMIFCAITRTPCVAINNSNGKVSGVYNRWLQRLGGVTMLESNDIEVFNAALERVKSHGYVDSDSLLEDFKPIHQALK